MTMEPHGREGGDGDGDEKCIGCDEMDLDLSLAPPELRERLPEGPPRPVVSREPPELLLPQQQQQQPSLSPKKSVLFRKLQPLRSSRLRAGAAATLQPRRRRAAPPALSSSEAVLPNRSAVTPRACTRIVEQTEFFLSTQVITSALPPARPPVEAVCRSARQQTRPLAPPPAPPPTTVRPAFATFFEFVYPIGQPNRLSVSSPAPLPVEAAARAPFPWAADPPATVRSANWLIANGITHINGEVRCSTCGVQKVVCYELESKVRDTVRFMCRLRHYLDDRTALDWGKEDLLPCDSCGGSKCVGPVIPARVGEINWLFMLLGQMLGALSLEQLRHFCRRTRIHCSGAKNPLLFDVYVQLCRQLIHDWQINAVQKE